MGKISRTAGPSIHVTAFGGHVNAGLTERAAGFSDAVEATVEAAAEKEHPDPPVTELPFDPAVYTVADILSTRERLTDAEWELVLASERAGLNRKGITG